MTHPLPAFETDVDKSYRVREILLLRDTHWVAVALAIFLVMLLRLSTPIAQPVNDGLEYLKVATAGLDPQAQLAAPFAYRCAVPLLVHGVTLLTGADPQVVFPPLVFLSCILLLIASYFVSLLAGASRGNALITMLMLACSLFVVRFPLYFPYAVDVEALAIAFLACALLLKRSRIAALLLSLIGLLFKEFLFAPLIVLIGLSFGEYLRDRTTRPLLWTILSLLLTAIVFLLPRLLIPVTYSYGTILQVKAAAPNATMYLSELRRFLAWPPHLGTFVNVLLAFVSFWLPVLMLFTRPRGRMAWHSLGSNRLLVLLWMGTVVLLMTVEGTNIMVFVTYSAPVLVLVLSLFYRSGVGKIEIGIGLIATVLFNRAIFSFGSPGGGLDPELTSFYGAYSDRLNVVTVWRFAEAAGWIILLWGTRRLFTSVPLLPPSVAPVEHSPKRIL